MNRLTFFTVTILILVFSVSIAFSQPFAKPDIKMEMSARKVVITEKIVDGKVVQEESYVSADEAFPGDIVQYDLRYWNEGDGAAQSVSIVGPIPYSTIYLEGTATEIEGAEMKYSIDRFFKIIEQTIDKLKNENIPKEVIDKLNGLKNREYDSEKDLENALVGVLGEEDTELYKNYIFNYSVDNNKPKTYNKPPIKYVVKEVDEQGLEKDVEKIASPDMYTSIQWNFTKAFEPKEEVILSYRVKIK